MLAPVMKRIIMILMSVLRVARGKQIEKRININYISLIHSFTVCQITLTKTKTKTLQVYNHDKS